MHTSPWRSVARAAVLLSVTSVMVVTVSSGVFDRAAPVFELPEAVPPAEASGEASGDGVDLDDLAGDPGAGDDVPGEGGAEGSDGEEDSEGAEADGPAAPAVDPACAAAEVAWAASNKARVNLSPDHPVALVEGFVAARDALAPVRPPEEIVPEWTLVAGYLTMLADAAERAGPDDRAALVRAIDRAGESLDADAMASASQTVTAYLRAGCTA